jgi:hypothetical protein
MSIVSCGTKPLCFARGDIAASTSLVQGCLSDACKVNNFRVKFRLCSFAKPYTTVPSKVSYQISDRFVDVELHLSCDAVCMLLYSLHKVSAAGRSLSQRFSSVVWKINSFRASDKSYQMSERSIISELYTYYAVLCSPRIYFAVGRHCIKSVFPNVCENQYIRTKYELVQTCLGLVQLRR